MTEADFAFIGAVLGGFVGALAAWAGFIRHQPRRLEITVTPEVLHQVNSAMVTAWLDRHGLMWQPRGLHEVMVRAKAAEQRGGDGHSA